MVWQSFKLMCANGGIKQCVLVSACVNGCMIGGEW